jgi:methionyl aminopeptidase
MITTGGIEWDLWQDDWTVTTKDKSLTAQFEHTILITEDGPEILTIA